MSYNTQLADRIRKYLSQFPELTVEEKKMFGGLAFMVNDKMCVNVSGENLMCRFDPSLTKKVESKTGYLPMTMKGKPCKGYCYVEPDGYSREKDFTFWMDLCLDFNEQAVSSKS